jgi:hypothetical protein
LIIALAACGEPAVGRDLEKYRTEPACREYFVSRDLDGLAGSGQDPTAALLGLFSAPCLHGVAIENAHIYRFVFQPSFEPQLVATVFAVNDSAWLWSFRVNPDDASDDAWDAATVRARSKESVRHLTSSEWREIQDQVEHSNFWGQAPIQYLLIEDGAFWTIEGWRDDQYNMTRGTDPSNECRDLFRYIIELD